MKPLLDALAASGLTDVEGEQSTLGKFLADKLLTRLGQTDAGLTLIEQVDGDASIRTLRFDREDESAMLQAWYAAARRSRNAARSASSSAISSA